MPCLCKKLDVSAHSHALISQRPNDNAIAWLSDREVLGIFSPRPAPQSILPVKQACIPPQEAFALRSHPIRLQLDNPSIVSKRRSLSEFALSTCIHICYTKRVLLFILPSCVFQIRQE